MSQIEFASDFATGQSACSIGVRNVCQRARDQCQRTAVAPHPIQLCHFCLASLNSRLYCYMYIDSTVVSTKPRFQTGWQFETVPMPSQSHIVRWHNHKVVNTITISNRDTRKGIFIFSDAIVFNVLRGTKELSILYCIVCVRVVNVFRSKITVLVSQSCQHTQAAFTSIQAP